MQSVKLLILFIVWLLSLAAFCFLIFPFRGEIVGLTIAIIYLTTIYLLLDKWVLLFLLAVPAKRGDHLLERFQNISYGHKLRDVSLYYSRLHLGNVIALEWSGRKIIILGVEERDSLDVAIYHEVLMAFKKGLVRERTRIAFMFTVYNLPIIFLEKFFGRFNLFNLLASIWLTPFQLILESSEFNKLDSRLTYQPETGGFDTYTAMINKILGLYKGVERDLVSFVFKKDFG